MSQSQRKRVLNEDTVAGAMLLGESRLRLLSALLLHPGPPLHMRALGRLARVALGLLQRELKTFEEIGLVLRIEQGRTVLFSVQRTHPLLPALREMVLDASGGLSVWLARQLASLDPASLVYLEKSPPAGQPLVLQVVSEVAYERWHERTLPLEPVLGRIILLRVLRPGQLTEPPDLSKWQALPIRPLAT